MNFESKTTFSSPDFSGVAVKLRKLSHGLRTQIDLTLASTRSRIRELSDEIAELREPAEASVSAELSGDVREAAIEANTSRADRRRQSEIWSEIQRLIHSEIEPAYLRAAVKQISGLTIDGVAVETVDALIEDGPPKLVKALYDAIQEGVLGLSGEERKNSDQPSTSAEVEAGTTNDTTAAPAGATPTS